MLETIYKHFNYTDEKLILKKANDLLGTDAEGYMIGNLIIYIVNNKRYIRYKKLKKICEF